ncbi:MAG: hypothetical protein ACLVHV_02230 [Oscillospiraceae bacterium]
MICGDKNGIDFILEILPQKFLIPFVQLLRMQAGDSVPRQELIELPANVVLFRNQGPDGGENRVQLLFCGESGFVVHCAAFD